MRIDASPQLIDGIVEKLKACDSLQKFTVYSTLNSGLSGQNIIIGKVSANSWHSAAFDGQEHTITIHVNTNTVARESIAAIIDLLHACEFEMKGFILSDVQYVSHETRHNEEQDAYHSEIVFTALTVVD